MYNIESLNDIYDTNPIMDFFDITVEVYMLTKDNELKYKNYKNWFLSKQLAGLSRGTREILFIRLDNKVVGMTALKKDSEETKLCTIFVHKDYRKIGIASALLEKSFEWLGTNKPFVTINGADLPDFNYIIIKYGWIICSSRINSYNGTLEYYYNEIPSLNNKFSI